MDIFQTNKLILFVLFFIPGFVSIKIWRGFIPGNKLGGTDYILEAISYSCINFALLFFLIKYVIGNFKFTSGVAIFCSLIYFFIGPVLWPVLLRKLLGCKWVKDAIIHPVPKAWDYFFGTKHPCFMLLHLKDGSLIGDYYAEDSFASSYPAQEDLYIRYTWHVNEHGEFEDCVEDTRGLLISNDAIDYIELFDVPERREKEGH